MHPFHSSIRTYIHSRSRSDSLRQDDTRHLRLADLTPSTERNYLARAHEELSPREAVHAQESSLDDLDRHALIDAKSLVRKHLRAPETDDCRIAKRAKPCLCQFFISTSIECSRTYPD